MDIKKNLNILITGIPGSGKTTLIKKIVQELESKLNLKGGGFYTEEIRRRNVREGFLIVTLDGQKRILAHIDRKSSIKISKYGVDVEGFEQVAVVALEEAINKKQIVVVDEIGKMELFSSRFQKAVINALDENIVFLATMGKVDHPFVRDLKRRTDISLFEVTQGNQDFVKAQILDLVRETLKERKNESLSEMQSNF